MRFDCGLSFGERQIERASSLRQWHRWFAWHPVRVASRSCVWLEWIERRYPHALVGHLSGMVIRFWAEYRFLEGTSP